jgi:hypothetical protein
MHRIGAMTGFFFYKQEHRLRDVLKKIEEEDDPGNFPRY